jgi:ESF2/ABP1 family protein
MDDYIENNLEENVNDEIVLEDLKDFQEKVRKSGVCYLSFIPEGMTVGFLKKKLSNYGVNRIYLVPDKKITKNKQTYKEGWIEFSNKLMGKLCEYELNGTQIGGKKRKNELREAFWTIKYLHKFKWHHLMEKLNFNRKLRDQRMKADIAQAKRETNFISEKFEQSKLIKKKKKKIAENQQNQQNENNQKKEDEVNDNKPKNNSNENTFDLIRRKFKQRKPII